MPNLLLPPMLSFSSPLPFLVLVLILQNVVRLADAFTPVNPLSGHRQTDGITLTTPSTPSTVASPSSLWMAAQSTDSDSCVFLLGTGFTQFLVVQRLARAGIKSVAMTDVATIESVQQNWITTDLCKVVTNGRTEWEDAAESCTSLVICPEVANIPGRTVQALMSKMPNVNRIVVLTPAGTTHSDDEKNGGNDGENWL